MLAMINPEHLNRYDARNLVTMTHDGKISSQNFFAGQNEGDVGASFEATRPQTIASGGRSGLAHFVGGNKRPQSAQVRKMVSKVGAHGKK